MGRNMRNTDIYLRVREVSERFGVAVSTVWRWADQGILPKPIKIGGQTRWVEAEILEVIKRAKADRESGGTEKRNRETTATQSLKRTKLPTRLRKKTGKFGGK